MRTLANDNASDEDRGNGHRANGAGPALQPPAPPADSDDEAATR